MQVRVGPSRLSRHWKRSVKEGRYTNSRVGPTWNTPKLRHFYWLLNRLTAAMTNENDVIYDCPT